MYYGRKAVNIEVKKYVFHETMFALLYTGPGPPALDAARTAQEEAVARWRQLAREVSAQPETGERRLDEGR